VGAHVGKNVGVGAGVGAGVDVGRLWDGSVVQCSSVQCGVDMGW